MPARYRTDDSGSQPLNIAAARARLDAQERLIADLERRGEPYQHAHFDVYDPRTNMVTHNSIDCPSCELRDLASQYRHAARARVIKLEHAEPKLLRGTQGADTARNYTKFRQHQLAMDRARAIYDDDHPECRMDEYGEIAPAACTYAERTDVAMEIRRLEAMYDAHNFKFREMERNPPPDIEPPKQDAKIMRDLGLE